MKKKSRKELAQEIIAMLRRGMNRQPASDASRKDVPEATPFMPSPLVRSSRTRPLQTSHSH